MLQRFVRTACLGACGLLLLLSARAQAAERGVYLWNLPAADATPADLRAALDKALAPLLADQPDVHVWRGDEPAVAAIAARLAEPVDCATDTATCVTLLPRLLESAGIEAFVDLRVERVAGGFRVQTRVAFADRPQLVSREAEATTVAEALRLATAELLAQKTPSRGAAFWKAVDDRPWVVKLGYRAARRPDWMPNIASKRFAGGGTAHVARGLILGFNGVEAEFGATKGMLGITWLRLGFLTTSHWLPASLDAADAYAKGVHDKFAVLQVWQVYAEPAQLQFRVPVWYLAPFIEGGLGFMREQIHLRMREPAGTYHRYFGREWFARWLIHLNFRAGLRAHPLPWLVAELSFALRQGIYVDYFTDLGLAASVGVHMKW